MPRTQRVEVESYRDMQERIREQNYQRCLSAGVTPEYLDKLTTAFIADGTLGFNMFHTEFLFKAGVTPEYANQYLVVGNAGELTDICALHDAGVDAAFGIMGLVKGLRKETIIELYAQGIPAEYVQEMSLASDRHMGLVTKAC